MRSEEKCSQKGGNQKSSVPLPPHLVVSIDDEEVTKSDGAEEGEDARERAVLVGKVWRRIGVGLNIDPQVMVALWGVERGRWLRKEAHGAGIRETLHTTYSGYIHIADVREFRVVVDKVVHSQGPAFDSVSFELTCTREKQKRKWRLMCVFRLCVCTHS